MGMPKDVRSSMMVNYDRSRVVGESFLGDRGRTEQAHKRDCDINTILAKAKVTGLVPGRSVEPMYGDFSALASFQEAQNIVLAAQAQFDALPALVRKRFHNDPLEFVEFANEPSNGDEMIKLGLAKRRVIPEPAASGVIPASSDAPAAPAASAGKPVRPPAS